MREWGRIRRRPDGRVYLQFGARHIYSDRGEPFRSEAHARHTLESVRGRAKEVGKEAALDWAAPRAAKRNQLGRYMDVWVGEVRDLVRAEERSPETLGNYTRWMHADGHIGAYWRDKSIYHLTTPEVSRWLAWLAERKLGAKTRWNIAAGFHRFCVWLVEQEAIPRVPKVRWPKTRRRLPTIISPATQQAILDAIPEESRGVYLAMARLGLRPSEAVELRQRDLRDGWLHVERARKGKGHDSPIWGTKTGEPKALPMPADLEAWLGRFPPSDLGALLFPNPRTGRAWAYTSLWRQWDEARRAVGVKVGLYEGTKHSTATALRRRGIGLDVLQKLLGHADPRSTELYAMLADQALVEAIRPRRLAQERRSHADGHEGSGPSKIARRGSNVVPPGSDDG